MPKFLVTAERRYTCRHRATTVIEAATDEDAEQIAADRLESGAWDPANDAGYDDLAKEEGYDEAFAWEVDGVEEVDSKNKSGEAA